MRRIALSLGILCLALSLFSAKQAQAGWSGADVDPACPGGPVGLAGTCPTAFEGCFSWALFYNPQNPSVLSMTPFYNSNGVLGGYTCTVNYTEVEPAPGVTAPSCTTGHADASTPSGCSDFVPPSPEQFGCDCNNNKNGKATPVGDPVNLATGNAFEQITDYQSAGPDKLEFKRYYNSQTGMVSSLGFGWKSNFDRAIFAEPGSPPQTDNLNLVWRPDGAMLYVGGHGTNWAMYYADNDSRIATDGATVWTFTDSNDTVETYGWATGKLLSIRTRSGYEQTLSYDANGNLAAVIDSYNRTLSFTYSNGLLQTMTDPDGRVYSYAYDFVSTGSPLLSPNPRLVGVTYPGAAPAPQVQYLYEDARFPYALTGIIDENGNRAASWTYDSARRVATNQRGGGADLVTFSYRFNIDRTNWITNALGEQFEYFFTGSQGKIKSWAIAQAANGPVNAVVSKLSFDGNGFVASRIDRNGITTTYTNDARGLVLSKTEASGTAQARTTTTTWHPTFHVPTQIVEPGRTTTFTYDANGFLLSKTETDTTTATVPYSTNGRTRTWTYTYTPAGLLASVKGPRTDVDDTVTYAWDGSGTLMKFRGHNT
jgi:YD repeat-containing protein